MRRRQRGTTTVEFAIVGSVAMLVLLSVIEFSRVLFVVNALGEGARRGARMAVVCPINDPAIARTAIFSRSGGSATSPVIQNLTTANVAVQYLDQAGAAVGDPTSTPDFLDIRYGRVSIENFQHQLVLPIPIGPITLPSMPTTFPRESLGVPRAEAVQPC
jgi:Flp pilus assembly protein TadG